MPLAFNFHLKYLANFYSNPFLYLKELWKKIEVREANAADTRWIQPREINWPQMQNRFLSEQSRVTCRKGRRERNESASYEGEKDKKIAFRRTSYHAGDKMSRMFHETPVRNPTVSRTSRKMCRSFLSREYRTLCVLYESRAHILRMLRT